MELLPAVIIVFSAFGGFMLAAYLSHKKNRPEPMVCPLKGDCAAVIRSEFSSFLGIPVEKLGMAYYLVTAIVYGSFLAWPGLSTPTAVFLAVGVSMAAFLFSLYLTFIQIGFLKELCTWCLLSAILSTVIFFAAWFGSALEFVPYLAAWGPLILVLHLVGVVLGVGGATYGDVFFFKFLKDLRISRREAEVLNTLSQVIWVGLGLLVISGVWLYLADPAAYNQSSKFLMKMVVVGVILVNGAFLNLKVAPRLVQISFGDHPERSPKKERQRERQVAFALGGISTVSWYSALILGALPSLPWSFPTLVLLYVALLALAVTGSQIIARYFGRKPMGAADTGA